MAIPTWQLQTPISAIVFDCDGTLSTIEGVNELAKNNGVYSEVEYLTTKAMSEIGLNPTLYQQRLKLIFPRQKQVDELGQHYFKNRTPDIHSIIRIFHRLNKKIYLVSAGLEQALKIFGDLLEIPSQNIYAVNIQFDEQGNFLNFDTSSPLIHNNGKRIIIQKLKQIHPQIIHVGDGLNDFVSHDIVTRFIGYGGVFYREKMANICEYYIHTLSMTPLLPLSLTNLEYKNLTEEEKNFYHQGLAAIQNGKVFIKK